MRGVIVGVILAVPSMAPAEPPTDAYPAAHTARPLLLPAAAIEGTATLEVLDIGGDGALELETYSLRPGARYGLAGAEVEAGVTLGLHESDGLSSESETLRGVDLAGRYGVSERASAGVELRAYNPASDFSSYLVAATAATRQRYEAASLDLGASAGYTIVSGGAGSNYLTARVHIAATAQLAPAVALRARGELYWFDYNGLESSSMPPYDWYLGQQYGLAALFAVSPTLDLTAGFDVLSNDSSVRLFTLGVAARRVP